MIRALRCCGALLAAPLLIGTLHAQTPNLLFDGVDDRVTVPSNVFNSIGTGPFTVEAWVRGNDADQPAHPRILSNRNVANSGVMLFFHELWGGSSHRMLSLQLGGMNYLLIDNGSYNGTILDGQCHHVAVSKGADSLRFHVDGSWIGSRALQGNPTATTSAVQMLIGNEEADPRPFDGNISQVRIWDHARSQAAIQADMHNSIAGTSPGLLGYWEMRDGAGQVIADATGNAPGHLGNSSTPEALDPAWQADGCPIALPGGCLSFDGVDDRITLPNTALNNIGTGSFTVEAWVRGNDAEQLAHPRILSNRNVANNGFMLFLHELWGGSSHRMLSLQLGGMNYLLIDNGSYNGTILDGECHHVAVSKGLDSLRFHVDGIWIGSKVLQGNPTATTSAAHMLIGNDAPDPRPFNGHLSQVRLWDHARTQAAIQADMHTSLAGNTPGLVGYWELDADAGQTVVDKTGQANGMLGTTTLLDDFDPTWSADCCELSPVNTGLEQFQAGPGLQIYPNPAREVLHIAIPDLPASALVRITDLTGREVMTTITNGRSRIALGIAHLPASPYLIQLQAGSYRNTILFIKE